jgi:pantoate kinase
MIREKRQRPNQIIIDLTGPDGNAFALMGYARQFARKLGLDSNKIIKEMTSGDYENLLKVFDKNFGSFVILER